MPQTRSVISNSVGRLLTAICLALMGGLAGRASQPEMASEYAGPDDRYKTDILLIVAHPDDDSGDIAGYLARAIFDEHRRAAVIYTTRGDAGGNSVGNEQGSALGMEREMEARHALPIVGVTNIWFLDAHDTPSQNVLRSLEYMDHGSILGQVIRLIRLTRPEVIITWLPLPVAGENHADHQAASVIANEAFDLAGDPSVFAEQLSTADRRDLKGLGHNAEGLGPWQPKKIYFFSDSTDVPRCFWGRSMQPSPFRKNFVTGAGPEYSNTDISSVKRVPYSRLIAEEASFYLTQNGEVGREAMARGDFKDFECPTRFILGKSLLGGSPTGDIFEGVTAAAIPFARPPEAAPQSHHGVSLQPGGQWKFYREFWAAHGLERVAALLHVPEFALGPGIMMGRSVDIPLLIRNDTGTRQDVTLSPVLPDGWVDQRPAATFPLPANSAYPVDRMLAVPATAPEGWYEVTWKAQADGRQTGSVTWRVYVIGSD